MLVDIYGQPLRSSARPSAGPSAMSAWWATQQNPTRKQLWNFGADPAHQVSPWARQLMDVQAQTLAANSGLAGCLKHLARIVGFLKPQATTGDPAYDTELETAFARVAEAPLIFDAAGVMTFYAYQVASCEARFVRGELFSLFTETTTGAARIAGRGAHAVGGKPENGDSRWHDGILANSDGFPLAYHFPVRGTQSAPIDAVNVFHHRTLHAMGAQRGITSLAHAINDIIDDTEIKSYLKTAIKNSSRIAMTRRMDAAHGVAPSSLGLNAPVTSSPFDVPDFAGSSADTDAEPKPPVSFEEFCEAGLFSSVPLDVLTDERPHPNVAAFREAIRREIANGLGVPHQLLYHMDDPGGAWSRMLLEALVKFIADQYLNHHRPFCQRFWAYAISKEIKAGRCPGPPRGMTPQQMWSVRWTPPRSMTADIGRMGRMTIEMRRALLTTFAAHFEEMGLNWEDELRQGSKEIKFLRDLEQQDGHEPGTLTGWTAQPGAAPAPSALADDIAALTAAIADIKTQIQTLKPAAPDLL